jgi:uncharacterized protein YbjT (DUF2867 family)
VVSVVIGGTGRTGSLIIDALRARGDEARAFGRGDGGITDADAVRRALRDVGAVVVVVESEGSDEGPNGPKAVHDLGVRNVLAALPAGARIVLVTQIYITRPDAYPAMAHVIEARRAGEEAVRESGAPYTIVRPSWLTDGPASGARLEQGDTGEGEVSRATVAEAVAAAVHASEAVGRTFELYNQEPFAQPDWPAAFAALQHD